MQEQESNQCEVGDAPARRGGRRKKSVNEPELASTACCVGFHEQKYDEEYRYNEALAATNVRAALRELERSMSVRDSISRKLCAGSDVVTVGDLRDAENALAGVKAFLAQLAHHNPILLRHPSIASTIR